MKSYLGIDLGGTDIKVGVVREDYTIAAKHSAPTMHPRPAEEIVGDMVAAGKKALRTAGLSEADINCVGVSVPSMVGADNRIIFANNLNWVDYDLAPVFRSFWDIPVRIVNDADAAALAEVYAGAAREFDNVVMLTLGTGIGGSIIIDRKIYAGKDNCGTEPGHIIIAKDGEPCTCGARGCFETYASVNGLIRGTVRAMAQYPGSIMHGMCGGDVSRIEGRTPFDAASKGDEAGQLAVDNYIGYLAAGIASLIVAIRPQAVILGGGVCNAGESLFGPLRKAVKPLTSVLGTASISLILKAELGNDAGVIGAALLTRSADRKSSVVSDQ